MNILRYSSYGIWVLGQWFLELDFFESLKTVCELRQTSNNQEVPLDENLLGLLIIEHFYFWINSSMKTLNKHGDITPPLTNIDNYHRFCCESTAATITTWNGRKFMWQDFENELKCLKNDEN
ncbi:hypothetical protein BpHYR1_026454 [Brachionus plicatilis]|uniref:Uncharacterized protein n=1 Tax=Brachionus plicatilis TaxID=10195 RepID=A0A3M7QXZ4_BRAPC|nr:hypothetical protein BpHYR1_026454 [Brachionus plicatilis]